MPRKRPSQARSQELVDAILDGAARVFRRRGFAATTNEIAEAAGVSVGSIYQYFPNKLALLAAWKVRFIRSILEEVEQALAEPAGGLEEGLSRGVACYFGACQTERTMLVLCARELPARVDVVSERSPPHHEILLRFLRRHASSLHPERDPSPAALLVGEWIDATARAAMQSPQVDLTSTAFRRELIRGLVLFLTTPGDNRVAPGC
jgi:AcrR family transcriptional regulator